MESVQQFDHETCHAIVLGKKRLDLLLVPNSGGLCLPSVEVPRRHRLAENLTAAMRTEWGCEVICLFSPKVDLPESEPTQDSFAVLELCHLAETNDARVVWVPISSLLQESFADARDYVAVQQSLAGCKVVAGTPMPGPFAAFGWFEQLVAWVKEASHPLELQLNGRFRQLNASPFFSLIRFETNGPALWFKAVGDPNRREFPITLALAQRFPRYIPAIVATRSEWNGWLALEVQGVSLGEFQSTRPWKAAATSLANLQIAAIGTHTMLLNSGARDIGAVTLLDCLQPFLERITQLMEEQRKVSPVAIAGSEVLLLGERIQDAFSVIEELGIPNTIGHLDLNPGNIIVSPNGCSFLDWAQAYVGHPFFSFEYLLEHFRSSVGRDPDRDAELTAAYTEPWRALLSPHDIARALHLAPMLAVFAYAAGCDAWTTDQKLWKTTTARHLCSLTRRMKREAEKLGDRRTTCLN